ncbi:hypothetical protein B0H13DRAFT_1987548 [Mycena leptocephala]|nr:hypothetical protein B0H13DRAFT_1987548 [Mycena leptocephala]
MFTNIADIEVYYRAFSQIAVPLIKKSKISAKERDFYFIAGIPKVIKDWLLTQVPEPKRKRSDPISFEPWTEEAKASPIPLDISSSPAVSTNQLSAVDDLARHLERLNVQSSSNTSALPANAVDELARQLERLNLRIAALSPGNPPQNTHANISVGVIKAKAPFKAEGASCAVNK